MFFVSQVASCGNQFFGFPVSLWLKFCLYGIVGSSLVSRQNSQAPFYFPFRVELDPLSYPLYASSSKIIWVQVKCTADPGLIVTLAQGANLCYWVGLIPSNNEIFGGFASFYLCMGSSLWFCVLPETCCCEHWCNFHLWFSHWQSCKVNHGTCGLRR